jgi:hypothetical protein
MVVAALGAWLLPISIGRLIDGDEGYLLMAARLIGEGHWPYRDFFLTQAPLLPSVLGAVFRIFGRSWLAARVFSGALAVAMGWLVYRESLSATRRQSAALFATAVFALNGASIGWLTIVKGYGLSAVLLLAVVVLVGFVVRRATDPQDDRRAKIAILSAGLALGLAASTRLYTVLVMPALAIYLVVKLGLDRANLRRLGLLAVGCLFGLLPLIVSFVRDPKPFLFDTLLFHAVREYGQDSLLGTAGGKLPVILKSFGLHLLATYGERQWMGLVIVAIVAQLVRLRLPHAPASVAPLVALMLIVASVLPNPYSPQYLCLVVPFLAVEAGRLMGSLLDAFSSKPQSWTMAVVVAAVAYLTYNGCVGWHDRQRFLCTGVAVPGIEYTDRVPRWRIETVEAVAEAVDAQHIAVAASWWPGYFVSSKTGIVLTLANDFAFRAASVLSTEERRRLHIVSHSEVGDMIMRRQPRLFVEGNWASYPTRTLLPQHGYQLRATVQNANVWTVD